MSGDTGLRRRALAIFDEVADLQGDARAQRLDTLCGDDNALRARVLALLEADAATTEPVSGDMHAWHGALTRPADESDAIGRTVGAWRIEGVLGRGGMGAVYAVERADGAYAQRAALKLIRAGTDSPAARERFMRERQTLARLQHPHVAALFDGGFSSEGDPYFVMERIDGVPIDQWCDARKLGLEGRVDLFLQVLDAVQYAHRNLVVHRDLKPSNLLVNQEGQVKLLDFGIAKELQGGEVTATNDRALTFEYASPEQLHDAPITTATDIWQLGIVLHRLLSGAHPFGLSRETPLARQLQMLESEPEPLTRAAAQASTDVTALRGHSPSSLSKALRGDLSNIVQGCLRRVPEQRYPSAEALADDLRRWRTHRPLRIQPPGRLETAQLWLRRHRVGASAAAAVTVAVLGGAGVALWQAHEAREQARIAQRESDSAQAMLGFLTDTFAAAAPGQALSTEVSVRQLLDRAREQLDQKTIAPDVRRSAQRMLGQLYGSLGESAIAAELYDAGLRDAQPRDRGEAIALADDLYSYTNQLYPLERRDEAMQASQRGADLRRQWAADDPNQQFLALAQLGTGYFAKEDFTRAGETWREALALLPQLPAPPVAQVLDVYAALSLMATNASDHKEGIELIDAALAFADRQRVPAQDPVRTGLLREKARTYTAMNDQKTAEAVLREGIALQEKAVGKGGIQSGMLYLLLGQILDAQGRYREALEAFVEADAIVDITQARPSVDKASTQFNLGNSYMAAGDYAKAEATFRRGIGMLDEIDAPADHLTRLQLDTNLARAIGFQDRFDEARTRLLSVRDRMDASAAADPMWRTLVAMQLMTVAQRSGDIANGRRMLAEARDRAAKLLPQEHPIFGQMYRAEATFTRLGGDLAGAERAQREAIRRLLATSANPTNIAAARTELAEIRVLQGDTAEARELLGQALPVLRASVLPQELKRTLAEGLARTLGV